MQDDTGSIFIQELHEALDPGTLIRLSGQTMQGWFAPDIASFPEITVLGRGPLPKPSTLSPHYFYRGKEDAKWVEIEGLVRSVRIHKNHDMEGIKIFLDSYGNEVGVEMYHPEIPQNLIGAFVKLQGVASGAVSPEKELIRVELRVPSIDFLEVITPGYSGQPDEVPLTSIGDVFTFSLDLNKSQYVRITGTVILIRPGKDFLVQDNSGTIYVKMDDTPQVHLGDSVNVVGFPSFDNAYLHVEDVIVYRIGKSSVSPKPVPTDSASHVANSSLVNLTGTLLETAKFDSTIVYKLTHGANTFEAHLTSGAELQPIRSGSILELSGVAELSYDPKYEAMPDLNPFDLHLRTPDDIVVLKQGPWWTTSHTRWFALGLTLTVLCAISWVVLLRRKIDEQTQVINDKNVSLGRAYAESQISNDNLVKTNQMLENSMDQLRKALEVNKEILGITAHDLKNPLGGIIGLADIVLFDSEKNSSVALESVRENVPMLKEEAERMLHIVKDLLDKHREGDEPILNKERVLLNDVLATVIRWNELQANNKDITLHYESSLTVIVEVDIVSIQRVLDNYVSNAIKYSPLGTNIWIEVHHNEDGVAWEKDPEIIVSVRDEGQGLTEEDKTKVFGKMQRLSAKPTAGEHSTGLGLYIVKSLIEAHGGRVGVESQAGHGATFWFSLPMSLIPS